MTALLSFLSYLLPPIVAPLVLLLRRKDYMALYHACQALSLFLGLAAVAVAWLVLGWLVAFLSVEAPWVYLLPVIVALIMPIWGMFKRSRIYQGRSIWWNILFTTLLAIVFAWACWKLVEWLSPNVLPIAGPLLLMSSFAIVMAALIVGAIAWVMGMIRALRGIAKPVPIFGAWGQRWFAATTRRAREALADSDAAALAAALLSEPGDASIGDAAANATISDEPILSPEDIPPGVLPTGTLSSEALPADPR